MYSVCVLNTAVVLRLYHAGGSTGSPDSENDKQAGNDRADST